MKKMQLQFPFKKTQMRSSRKCLTVTAIRTILAVPTGSCSIAAYIWMLKIAAYVNSFII